MPQSVPPDSLLDALLAYEAYVRIAMPQKKADATMAQVRTALWRYTLPGWGFRAPRGQRLSQEEYEQGITFLKQLPLERLRDALEVQERLFENLTVAGNSRRNYRWALNSFIDWCKQQSWFDTKLKAIAPRPLSRKRQRKRSANDVRLTTHKRQKHRLAETERTEALQQELELFSQFLMKSGLSGQAPKGVSLRTANQYLNQVVRVLGWLHREREIPIQELRLSQLIKATPNSGEKEPRERQVQGDAERAVDLVQAYLQWLRVPESETLDEHHEVPVSPYTAIQVINTWLAVARFVYQQDAVSGMAKVEESSVTVAALEFLRKKATARLKSHQPVSDESKKRLEWHEFLDLVEQLRGECVSRFRQNTQSKQGGSTLGPPRTLTAIAQSYQRFLIAAFLAYIPPQRQHVLRNLTIARLPFPEQSQPSKDFSGEESILYQDQESWWIKVVDRKIRRQPPHYLILVPNLSYVDGRCFYQYLEEWLSHYVFKDIRGETVEVPGLRSCFNPQHHRLFTMKNGQPYQDSPAFIKLLRHPAYRISGKALDFQAVRRMYAKHLTNKEDLEPKSKPLSIMYESEDITCMVDPTNLDEDYEYNLADWQKAAEIAQAFLNQLASI